jgi:cellulose synthase/poly-beta-1,6-N-acetylglucosamine synthase-like glycosyltransferase
VLQNELYGKKNALKIAMKSVKNEFIACFDADCVLPKNYFSVVKNFLAAEQPDLMIGGVKFQIAAQTCSGSVFVRFFQQMQSLEFASLQASGAGAALAKMPILCNGANLAFRREIWQMAENKLIEEEISGDDIFLLHYVKKIGKKILYLKSEKAFVQTNPEKSLRAFFNQRKRWASKSRSYTDYQTILAALAVFFVNFEIVFSFITAFFIPFFKICFLIIFLSKILIDSVLLIPFLKFSNQNKLIKFIPLLSFFYPFYIIFTAIFGIFGKTQWK